MGDFILSLKKKKLLFEEQYGFRKKCSTTDILTNITKKIRDACDKGYSEMISGVNIIRKASIASANRARESGGGLSPRP